jgi:hypothetical protein
VRYMIEQTEAFQILARRAAEREALDALGRAEPASTQAKPRRSGFGASLSQLAIALRALIHSERASRTAAPTVTVGPG